MSDTIKYYHKQLIEEVSKALIIAQKAKMVGYDPKKEVEIYIAQDVAARTEGLVGPPGIAARLKEMENEGLSKDEIVVKVAKEIAKGKFGFNTPEKLAEQAMRTALSYQTEGITAAPIEGVGKVIIKNNPDNSQYLAVYYSGPIRSAGGTAQGVSVFIADIIRKELGLAKYKATSDEVNRMLEEVRLYNKIMHLQLPTTDEEIKHAWSNIPVMITGDPTEKEEVGGYRNIESMDTNRVRGGACLVLNDGLVGRAKKIIKRINKLNIEGWEWLEDISDNKYKGKNIKKIETYNTENEVAPEYGFVSDALMGRPIFSGPTAQGGFRLRYGHARNTGIAGVGVHPAVMAVVNDYLAPGTHVRTERPGKGSIVTPVDSIRPPIVLLKSGEVMPVETYEEGKKILDQIESILFLGDMLVGFGEFIQNNYKLCPVGYNEEWWYLEMKNAGWSFPIKELQIFHNNLTVNDALKLAIDFKVALHPKFTPAWKYLNKDEILKLAEVIKNSTYDKIDIDVKLILEKIFVPHTLDNKNIIIEKDYLKALKAQFGDQKEISLDELQGKSGLEIIKVISKIRIKDTIGTTIGARMGRPEKAKSRQMKKITHGLFPVGSNKKIRRVLSKAAEIPYVNVFLGNRLCETCNIRQYHVYCHNCKEETKIIGTCSNNSCRSKMDEGPCDICGSRVNFKTNYQLSVSKLIDEIYNRLGSINTREIKFLDHIKNEFGIVELPDKGVLRAKYNLNVFRDGTIRYDATDAPLTHFYPYELGTDWTKLKELGYHTDYEGQELNSNNQLLEIFPQDIIVHKSSIQHLQNVSNFVDDELEHIYHLDRFYNVKSKDDLIGHLIIGLAPHTSAGVIGRVIGFNQSSVCWAHPYWHASKRRNCDGDEDGIILLLDGFINFSKNYLPTSRGSKMDTPLVLVVTMNPSEVDDEAFNLDSVDFYPLDMYNAASKMKMPNVVVDKIERVENRLGRIEQFEGFKFSHNTQNISQGPLFTRYKDPNLSIREKLRDQLELARIINAVNLKETAKRILERHVLPDLLGNLRAFSSQTVRCITCKTKYRRIPLTGKCISIKCERSNLVLTVPPRGVSKYLDICEMLIMDYKLGKYHEDRLEKIKLAINSQLNIQDEPQTDLSDWLDFE